MRQMKIKESLKKATILSLVLAVFGVAISFSYNIEGCKTVDLMTTSRIIDVKVG